MNIAYIILNELTKTKFLLSNDSMVIEIGYKTALLKHAVVAGALLNDDAMVRRPLDRLIPIPDAPFSLFSIRNACLILVYLSNRKKTSFVQ